MYLIYVLLPLNDNDGEMTGAAPAPWAANRPRSSAA